MNIPNGVFSFYVLPHLSPDDVIALRCTCRHLRALLDLPTHPKYAGDLRCKLYHLMPPRTRTMWFATVFELVRAFDYLRYPDVAPYLVHALALLPYLVLERGGRSEYNLGALRRQRRGWRIYQRAARRHFAHMTSVWILLGARYEHIAPFFPPQVKCKHIEWRPFDITYPSVLMDAIRKHLRREPMFCRFGCWACSFRDCDLPINVRALPKTPRLRLRPPPAPPSEPPDQTATAQERLQQHQEMLSSEHAVTDIQQYYQKCQGEPPGSPSSVSSASSESWYELDSD